MLREKINQAWLYRYKQEIEGFTALLQQCKFEISKDPKKSQQFHVDLLLLDASLSRAKKEVEESDLLLERAKKEAENRGIPVPVQYFLQSGLNCYLKADYTKALDQFLTAGRMSGSKLEKAWALSNVILCLEVLGLPGAQIYHEFKALLVDLESEGLAELFLTTLHSYELRAAFRIGNFSAVLQRQLDSEVLRQEHYYQLWVSGLPFQACPADLSGLRERFFLASPWLHQKSYRIRTLQVQLHPDDMKGCTVGEFADRLYYWVWQWLADPQSGLIDRVMELIGSIELNELSQKLSVEDFQMIRNALRWLSLFDPASFGFVHKFIQILQIPFAQDYSIFEFERLSIDYLAVLRDGGESRSLFEALQRNPLWESTEFLLPSLLREVTFVNEDSRVLTHTRLQKLRDNLIQNIYPEKDSSDSDLFVDLSCWIVRATAEKKKIISEPMCLAFQLLKSQGSVSFENFLRVSFGISRYESEIHDAKILNLLARMRGFAPAQLTLKTKSGRVYASGSWNGVTFINRPADAKSELSQAGWKKILASKVSRVSHAKGAKSADRWERPFSAMNQLQNCKEVSRAELEKILGKSRSSANRMITLWLKQGRLRKTGAAKNTRYTFIKKNHS